MTEERWALVDEWLGAKLLPADPALDAALADSAAAGLPEIQVAPNQGKMLAILAGLIGARNVLEIGTLGGYSTIWLARGLPSDGRLVTLELSPDHAKVARGNLERAGLADRVEVRVGPAAKTLAEMVARREGPFDFVFVDADKPGTTEYFERALELTRPGGLIVVDNVVRKGAIVDADTKDDNVLGMRRFLDRLAIEPRVESTVLQTVGGKGWDGFALIRVRENQEV